VRRAWPASAGAVRPTSPGRQLLLPCSEQSLHAPERACRVRFAFSLWPAAPAPASQRTSGPTRSCCCCASCKPSCNASHGSHRAVGARTSPSCVVCRIRTGLHHCSSGVCVCVCVSVLVCVLCTQFARRCEVARHAMQHTPGPCIVELCSVACLLVPGTPLSLCACVVSACVHPRGGVGRRGVGRRACTCARLAPAATAAAPCMHTQGSHRGDPVGAGHMGDVFQQGTAATSRCLCIQAGAPSASG
jgi:hypothetical protein